MHGRAEDDHHGEDGPCDLESRVRECEQEQRTDELERDADREDHRAIAPVCDMTRGQHEQHERQELRQADQAEVERIVRDRVNLPADGDGLHLHGDRRKEPRGQETREIRVGEKPAEWRACGFDESHAIAVTARSGAAASGEAVPPHPRATDRRP
jgi:hypothetical protein